MLYLTSLVSGPASGLFEMPATCQKSDSWTCAAVYSWTGGNETLARTAAWLIGKPLTILVIVVGAIIVRWLACKTIDRVVQRAQAAPLGARSAFNRRACGSLSSLMISGGSSCRRRST